MKKASRGESRSASPQGADGIGVSRDARDRASLVFRFAMDPANLPMPGQGLSTPWTAGKPPLGPNSATAFVVSRFSGRIRRPGCGAGIGPTFDLSLRIDTLDRTLKADRNRKGTRHERLAV